MDFALVSGLIVSGSYLLLSLGFTLMLRIADIVNLLHGSFVVGAMYLVVVLVNELGLPYVLAAPLAVVLGLVVCWLLYELVLRSARREGHRSQIIFTLLLFSVFEIVFEIAFGPQPLRLGIERVGWDVFGVAVLREQAIGFVIAIAVTLLFFFVIRFTALGKAAEIAGKHPEGAVAIGLPVERLYRLVFLTGATMALLAGALLIPSTPVTPFQTFEYLLIAVIVGIAARLSFLGCIVASVLFGLGYQVLVGLTNDAELATVAIYGIFLVVIAATPALDRAQRALRSLAVGTRGAEAAQ